MKKTSLLADFKGVQPPQNHVLFTVCPGSDTQRGDMLRASVLAVRDAGWHVTFLMADTLDFWNMKRSIPDDAGAMTAARERGRDWMRAYKPDLDEMWGGRYRTLYWDEIKSRPEFDDRINTIHQIYRSNPEVREEFDGRVERHTSRLIARLAEKGKSVNRDWFKECSLNYLLEEYAGLTVLKSLYPYPEVYGGDCIHQPDFLAKNGGGPKMMIPEVIGIDFTPIEKKRGTEPQVVGMPG